MNLESPRICEQLIHKVPISQYKVKKGKEKRIFHIIYTRQHSFKILKDKKNFIKTLSMPINRIEIIKLYF